jgi:squalene synthase HpnC
VDSLSAPLAAAYEACDRVARSHYENFPVASRLLPRGMRPHIAAVYAFARIADDIADEGLALPLERQERLRAWLEQLHRAAESEGGTPWLNGNGLIVRALGHTIRSLDLPLSLFDDLVSAFRQDTMTTRYASWRDILDYCRRSANPVGRLVLRIAGYRDEAVDRSSDALCTALQLTNFWQDFGRDWRAGRLYVPREVLDAAGARETDLAAEQLNPDWARAIDTCIGFTRDRYREGMSVCDAVRGRLRYELRFTWLGGRRILERVAARRTDLLRHRPKLGAVDLPVLVWRACRWTGLRQGYGGPPDPTRRRKGASA